MWKLVIDRYTLVLVPQNITDGKLDEAIEAGQKASARFARLIARARRDRQVYEGRVAS